MLNVLVPLQTKAARTVTKLEKEIQCWGQKFIASHSLCAPIVTDRKNNKK